MGYNVEKMLVCTICQKCFAKPTKTPMIDFTICNGLLSVPDIMHCPECGNYVTIQVREMTKEELGERDKKTAQAIVGAHGKIFDEAVRNDPLNEIPKLGNMEVPAPSGFQELRLEGSNGSVIEGEKSEDSVRGVRADMGVITGDPITDNLPPLSFDKEENSDPAQKQS